MYRTARRLLLVAACLTSALLLIELLRRHADAASTQERNVAAQTSAGPNRENGLPDFDIRAGQSRSESIELRETANELRGRRNVELRRRVQSFASDLKLLKDNPALNLRWSTLTGRPSRMFNLDGPIRQAVDGQPLLRTGNSLQGASSAGAVVLARQFLNNNSAIYGLARRTVDALRTDRLYQTDHNGLTHVVLQQDLDGIDLFRARMAIHLDRSGNVVAASGELFPEIDTVSRLREPRLSVEEALNRAAAESQTAISGAITKRDISTTPSRRQRIDRSAGFARDVDAKLVYFPVSGSQPRLAWELVLWLKDTPDVYLTIIDAENGVLLYRYNLTSYDQNPLQPHGLVYKTESPAPHNPYTGNNSPAVVPQEDAQFHAEPFNGVTIFPIADKHYDWWAGAAATGLISNNTDTHLDRDLNGNVPDLPRLVVPTGNFAFTTDLTTSPDFDPTARAAQVNLFYWLNRYHDILYGFGFNEAAGNFQTDNFGLGGFAADAILADAQDGSGTNNANFSTPSDGSPGRVQMFLWTSTTPSRDGDFDQGVIIHELTHGLSNRLVGNANGLVGMQSRSMGEGWSDYFSLVLQRSANDNPDGSYGVGQYVVNRYTRGIRRFPYSTSLTTNPLTLSDIAANTEVHAVGEIWCAMLWEMRRLLVERYGFQEGQRQSIQLVVDGLKLTPDSPTLLDARDAIMVADRVNNAGANLCLISKAFAKRGAGYYARSTDASEASPFASFEEAPYCSDSGTLTLDQKNYLPGEPIVIRLGDRNAPNPPSVQLRSSVTGDTLTLNLTPEPNTPGSFSATIPTVRGTANPNDGTLQGFAELGDEIRVTYHDTATANQTQLDVVAIGGFAREKSLLTDNVELGNSGWIPTGTWGITSVVSASATRSWLVRGSGNDVYLPSIALTSPALDFSQFTDVTLEFSQSLELFSGFNYGVIEYSIDDGVSWVRQAAFTGSRPSFEQAAVKLSALDGKTRGRVRFVLQNPSASSANFWAVDDIVIRARSANPAAIGIGPGVPVIDSIEPSFGKLDGGTLVTINGHNLGHVSSVKIGGGFVSSPTVVSNSVVQFFTPASSQGTVQVNVTSFINTSNGVNFTYRSITGGPLPTPSLAQIYPASGSTNGDTTVKLFGTGFTPETIVTFGTAVATATFLDEFTLKVIVPSRATTGPVSVQVKNGAAVFTKNDAYVYTAPTPPEVTVDGPANSASIFAGSTIPITWRSTDNRQIVKHRIFFRYLVGQSQFQSELASDLGGGEQSFAWQVPLSQPAGTQGRIHVVATDDEGAQTDALAPAQIAIAQRWERIRNSPQTLTRAQVGTDAGALWVFGGRTSTTEASTINSVSRYDAATNAWISGLSVMPVGLNAGDVASINGRLYIPGGVNASNILTTLHNAYDVASNSWVPRTASTVAVYLYSIATDAPNGLFYLTGGNSASAGAVASARIYNVAGNSWSELPVMSRSRHSHESALIGGKLYVAGGVGPSGGLTHCEVFDPATMQWAPIASLNAPRSGGGGFVTQNAGGTPLWVLVGGFNTVTGLPLGAEAYDVNANRWITLDNSYSMTAPRTSIATAVASNFFYTIGGSTPTNPSVANERLPVGVIDPIPANTPPSVAVVERAIGIVGESVKVEAKATDVGSPNAITLVATGLPGGATFTTSLGSNNQLSGQLSWTPSEADKGKTFAVDFTANDGQFSNTRRSLLTVVEAAAAVTVNAADFHTGTQAPDSLVAIFGTSLALRTESAPALPLPLELGGATVTVNGQAASLLFASPQQINLVLPSGLPSGPVTLVVASANGTYSFSKIIIEPSTPALFTTTQDGKGDAAAQATTDGITYQSAPFSITVNGKPNVLVLFGTGFRNAVADNPYDDNGVAEAVTVTIGGVAAQVLYVGAHGQFAGLDQINVILPPSLAGGPPRRVDVEVIVNGKKDNPTQIAVG